MTERTAVRRENERGFALILAILSLMLLTFLGLTLATTTSTELQIATNYRWSQQALYNAEAGLEAGKIVLSQVADITTQWQATLPQRRVDGGGNPLTWPRTAPLGPVDAIVGRDFERRGCDTRGGIGFGRVLADTTTRYENVSSFGGQTLNGAFTVWIRRNLQVDNSGLFSDDSANDRVIIVAEGVAPYSGAGTTFTRANQATRVLETRYNLALATVGDPCLGTQAGQQGGSPMGENFNPCAKLATGATGSLQSGFGTQPGAGGLTGTGVQ